MNNREIALAFWIAVAFAASMFSHEIRTSMRGVARAAVHWKISVPFAVIVCYCAALVLTLKRAGLGYDGVEADTGIWLLFVAFPVYLSIHKAHLQPRFFRRLVTALIAPTAVAEFVLNLWVFPLIVELILQPVLVFLGLLAGVAAADEKTKPVGRLFTGMLSLLGVGIALVTVRQLMSNWTGFEGVTLAKSFLLPIGMSIALLPVMFAISLASSYEQAFLRLDFGTESRKAGWKSKVAVVIGLHVRMWEVAALAGNFAWARKIAHTDSFGAATRAISEFKGRGADNPPPPRG